CVDSVSARASSSSSSSSRNALHPLSSPPTSIHLPALLCSSSRGGATLSGERKTNRGRNGLLTPGENQNTGDMNPLPVSFHHLLLHLLLLLLASLSVFSASADRRFGPEEPHSEISGGCLFENELCSPYEICVNGTHLRGGRSSSRHDLGVVQYLS
ncbi:hypothetical protein INR49_004902, partial [Caranx melampygus]